MYLDVSLWSALVTLLICHLCFLNSFLYTFTLSPMETFVLIFIECCDFNFLLYRYHKACFKCASGGCRLSASNYARALDGAVYCKPHFMAAFKEKGDYQTAFSCSNPAPENAGPNS